MTSTSSILRLKELKEKNNAIILAHYYVEPEIQEIADFLGDSLALAQQAKETDADVILFCGVKFMAETAKILNPQKTVLLPDISTGCSLADLSPASDLRKWKNSFENPFLVSYINCSAEVKAISDVICTSSNAEKILKSIPKDKTILFATDKYLGSYIKKKLGIEMEVWKDYCIVHQNFSEEHLRKLIENNADAEVVAHPECSDNLLKYADFVGSTTGIINYTKESNSNKFIVLTELGILHQLKKLSPHKEFLMVNNIEGNCNICKDMKKNTIEGMILALENLSPQIVIDEDLRKKALIPLELMLKLSK